LLELLKDNDSDVRITAAYALVKLGNSSDTVVKALLERLKDNHSFVRKDAAYALGELGKRSNNVVPTVIEWIEQHQDSEYVGRGIDVLWDLVVDRE
ncbi:MAG: HEAT repeat domain-containing protein, partial [Moorea sp. SIO4G2]|nr:HEAT repeat domain-containing protein [Moorena sp. SIO4G2]